MFLSAALQKFGGAISGLSDSREGAFVGRLP
jgi:hypothetical protein